MQSALEEFSNDMRKFKNGFLNQKIWLAKVQGFKALGRKEHRSRLHIKYENIGAHHVDISDIITLEINTSRYQSIEYQNF